MSPERYAGRRAALAGVLESQGLDGLVVSGPANVRYLTGFTGSAGAAVLSRRAAIVVTDSRYTVQARGEVDERVRVEIVAAKLWLRVWELVRELPDVGVVGYEAHVVTAEQARQAAEFESAVSIRATVDLVEGLRVRKEPEEIAAIREAARLAGDAFEAAIGEIRVGRREIDVAARLEYELRIRGSEWHPFPTIVASGPRSALPHARTSSREIAQGDWVLLDFGAQLDGYCADISRTVVVGQPADDRQRAMYALVEEAQRRARQGLRAGVTGREADAYAREFLESAGVGEAFTHSLGHGIGLEVHEAPRVSRTNEGVLPEGAVVTVEPGLYIEGWGGIRLEDDVVLGRDGTALLSDGQLGLRELT